MSERGGPRHPRVVRNRLHARPGDDAFFRRIVAAMRNGVLAITRDNCIALINDEAYRIFEIEPSPDDVGRPFRDVLSAYPEVVRALEAAPDTALLANRAELRLKPSGKVIGYTLAHVHADSGDIIGTSMFFTDLTRVEQIEERERLRDRLDMEAPPVSTSGHAARFHTPFEVIDDFNAAGFEAVEAWPFHYHAGPPSFEASHPQAFRDESIALEHETSGWKGLFLCSAFIIRARRLMHGEASV